MRLARARENAEPCRWPHGLSKLGPAQYAVPSREAIEVAGGGGGERAARETKGIRRRGWSTGKKKK